MSNSRSAGTVFEGNLDAKGLKFGIVCARFNDFFVSRLLDGAMDAIVRHGGSAADVAVAYVPGSYEIPFAVKKLLLTKKFDAVLALGVVIQGATSHAGYINAEVAKGLAQLGLEFGVPVTYGMITAENLEQAIESAVDGDHPIEHHLAFLGKGPNGQKDRYGQYTSSKHACLRFIHHFSVCSVSVCSSGASSAP